MRRRSYLAGSVGLIGGLAGCAGILGDSGGSGDPSDPDEVAAAFIEAIADGDVAAANDLLHPESPGSEVDQSTVEEFQSRDASVDDVTVEFRNDTTARVDVVVRANTEDGDSGTVTFPFELRKRDGEWLVYEDLSATGSPPRAPQVQWESSERTDADGSVTAVTFTHGGGDTVPSGTLSVHADASAATATDGTDVTAGTTLTAPTDGRGNSIAASTAFELVWSDPDGGDSQVLVSHTLGGPTVGTLSEAVQIE